jgi:hypothetical protein
LETLVDIVSYFLADHIFVFIQVKIQMMGDSKLGKDVYEYLSESDEENKSLEEKVLATAEDVKRKNDKQSKGGWFSAAKSLFW